MLTLIGTACCAVKPSTFTLSNTAISVELATDASSRVLMFMPWNGSRSVRVSAAPVPGVCTMKFPALLKANVDSITSPSVTVPPRAAASAGFTLLVTSWVIRRSKLASSVVSGLPSSGIKPNPIKFTPGNRK